MNDLPGPSNSLKRALDGVSVVLSTCGYTSVVPSRIVAILRRYPRVSRLIRPGWTGAGLVGSVFGFVTYLFLPWGVTVSIPAIAAGILLSVWASGRAERVLGIKDDSRIVIDEWIGTWIAMAGLEQRLGLGLVVAFLLFRVFDVFKGPWGNWLQRLPGGWGVTLDDVAAGLLANFFARIIIVTIGML